MSATIAPARTILDAYLARTAQSRKLAEEARACFPSGITHDTRHQEPYGIYVDRASGSRKWDADGNEYVDYAGGHGALLLGHNHPHVTQAVQRQLQQGTHYGSNHRLEIDWARSVMSLVPSAENVRFTSSGTEATMLALRVARAATGRAKILRFAGHFHGWHDHMAFGVTSNFQGGASPGVLSELAEQTCLAPPGDVDKTRAMLESQEIAAVIVEPTGASWGQLPLPGGFLTALRELTAATNTVLIFDEVISGFRCSPGGAQAHYGVTPDLTTLAKILAGGLPGGALVGRKPLLDWLSFSPPGPAKIPHHGTFNANPLSAAAGIAALEIVANTPVCQQANDYAAELRNQLSLVAQAERVPWIVYGSFSGFHIFLNPRALPITREQVESGQVDFQILKERSNPKLQNALKLGMLVHGVELFGWPGGPTSCVHTPQDLQQTVDAFRETIRMLRTDGLV